MATALAPRPSDPLETCYLEFNCADGRVEVALLAKQLRYVCRVIEGKHSNLDSYARFRATFLVMSISYKMRLL